MSERELDPRLTRGAAAMLALRSQRLAGGERPLGWKLGFGAPAALEKLGTGQPLVGFLTDATLLPDGASVEIGGWSGAAFEAEIAVHMGADVEPGATRAEVEQAIAGLGPAIELAAVDADPVDPEAIMAGNIFHRQVLLGPVDEGRRSAAGIGARVLRDGEEVARTDAPEATTGELTEIVRLAAELLASAGERLRAGEVVIAGSVVPPLPIEPGQRITAELGPLGSLSVELV